MREFFDYDPITGLAEYVEFADGKMHLTYEQDVEAVLNHTKALANEGLPDKNFKGEGWLYAIIPAVVEMQMRKKGINLMDPTHVGKVVKEINENYPLLKTTHRHHAIKGRG